MKHDATHYALIGAIWAAAIVAGVVLWLQASELPRAMALDHFQRTVRKIRSDALEGRELALQLADGQLTASFAAQQHRKLGDDLVGLRKALDKPPPRAHEAEAESARAGIDRLEALLKAVPVAMADAQALHRLADQEAALAKALPPTPP